MSTLLVSGSSGFIASNVVRLLLAAGHQVIGVDNMNEAYDVRLKRFRKDKLLKETGFIFHELDIGDELALEEKIFSKGKIDAVINLAARAGVRQSVANPDWYVETNLSGTLSLLKLCRKYDVGKFVLSSTSSVYGNREEMPYVETMDTSFPLSPYAASKKAAEQMCYTYHYLYGIDVTIFRYFTVYGPAGRPDMSLFRFVKWINEGDTLLVYGDGSQSRDFTHVEDIARGTVAGLKRVGYDVFNLGSDYPIVLNDAISMIEGKIGKRADVNYQPRHVADVLNTWASIEKASSVLGWTPRISFEEGVQSLVDWYSEHREFASTIVTG